MDAEKYVPLLHLCKIYHAEVSFFEELSEFGLIQIVRKENDLFLHQDHLIVVERVFRIHRDLNVNIEGIDVVMNLLEKVEDLQNEIHRMQSRLRLYEDDF